MASYRRAIVRACEAAGVERWTPHQLRHAAATRLAADWGAEGLDAVRALLGHADLRTTLGYAHADERLAVRLAGKAG